MRRHLLALALVAALTALGGCASAPPAPKSTATVVSAEAAFPVTITDDASRTVTIEKAPERIVSLAPANTEILASLGLLPKLVGVTTFDDYPAEVKDLPKVGDFMTPNLEAIAAAKPDVVFVTGGVQAEVVKKLEGLGAKVVVIDPKTLDGVKEAVAVAGKVTGTARAAKSVVDDMDAQIAEVGAKVGSVESVTCFVEIAQNPLFTAGSGTLFDDMITVANGRNVVAQPGFVSYSLEQLLKDDPRVYLVTKGSMSDPAGLAKRAGYDKLAAVKDGRVVVLDDNLVSRPGPRITQGLRIIAEALHPDAFK